MAVCEAALRIPGRGFFLPPQSAPCHGMSGTCPRNKRVQRSTPGGHQQTRSIGQAIAGRAPRQTTRDAHARGSSVGGVGASSAFSSHKLQKPSAAERCCASHSHTCSAPTPQDGEKKPRTLAGLLDEGLNPIRASATACSCRNPFPRSGTRGSGRHGTWNNRRRSSSSSGSCSTDPRRVPATP